MALTKTKCADLRVLPWILCVQARAFDRYKVESHHAERHVPAVFCLAGLSPRTLLVPDPLTSPARREEIS